VRPGLTGLAQVRGRNTVLWADRIEVDLEYIRDQSPLLDLRILWWTVSAVLRGGGVEGHPTDDPLARPPE
jgi:lipopolysaccharide/colanic/teichoic acid biosynthesis glycosyltransferase